MTIREFSREEKVVFLAIAEQSKCYPDEPFAYDVKEGQLFINNKGVALDRSEHLDIIRRLTQDKIIDADWLIQDGGVGESGTAICSFARDSDWVKQKFSMYAVATTTRRCDDYCFVNIHPSRIKMIEDSFTSVCTANIVPVKDPVTLMVRCDRGKASEHYVIRAFKDAGRQQKVVTYALKHPGRPILREELNQKIKDEEQKELIALDANIAKMFERNRTVRNELSPLIILGASFIQIEENVKLSQLQYEAIKAKAINT